MNYSGGVSAVDKDVVVFRALAHPVRWGILRELSVTPETCACDFTEVFGVSQPTISQHLRVLRESGLVTTRRRGTQICYSVTPEALERLQGVLADVAATAHSARAQREIALGAS